MMATWDGGTGWQWQSYLISVARLTCRSAWPSPSLLSSLPPSLPHYPFFLVCFWITYPTSDAIHVAQLLLCLPSVDTVMTFWLSVFKWAMKWVREKWGHALNHLVQIGGLPNALLWQELKVRNMRLLWMHEITLQDLIDPFESIYWGWDNTGARVCSPLPSKLLLKACSSELNQNRSPFSVFCSVDCQMSGVKICPLYLQNDSLPFQAFVHFPLIPIQPLR